MNRQDHFEAGVSNLADHGIDPIADHGFVPVPEDEWRDVQHRMVGEGSSYARRSISTSMPLHTGQLGVYADTVAEYAGNLKSAMRQDDPIEIIKDGDKTYMGQGHHRMAAARMAGRKRITVDEYTARPK